MQPKITCQDFAEGQILVQISVFYRKYGSAYALVAMDTDGTMIIAVKDKRITFLLEYLERGRNSRLQAQTTNRIPPTDHLVGHFAVKSAAPSWSKTLAQSHGR
ncbi:MAG TPA: hypothetical protein PJ982_19115 [Lacipirellulaceae bacterium]|nr:hypothetical protein [Lacipirellulaceae bacterium]